MTLPSVAMKFLSLNWSVSSELILVQIALPIVNIIVITSI